MPRKYVKPIKLPKEQPTRCNLCPLCYKIPAEYLPHGSKQTHICAACCKTISGKGIQADASQRDSRHPLHRHCAKIWGKWMEPPFNGQIYVPLFIDKLCTNLLREQQEPTLFAALPERDQAEKATSKTIGLYKSLLATRIKHAIPMKL